MQEITLKIRTDDKDALDQAYSLLKKMQRADGAQVELSVTKQETGDNVTIPADEYMTLQRIALEGRKELLEKLKAARPEQTASSPAKVSQGQTQ